jgi:integrase
VREALAKVTEGKSDATAAQYVTRIKSLLSYGHKLGYMPFNAGVTIKVRPNQQRGLLAQRIIPEVDVKLLIRAARSKRDRILLAVAYAGGLRISELLGLNWADIIERDGGKVQLSITGKGGKVRQVLLPEAVGAALLDLRGSAGADAPVFTGHKTGERLAARTVNIMLKRTAKRAHLSHLAALASPRPRQPCARPWSHACRSADDLGAFQRGDDVRLPACPTGQLKRAIPRPWNLQGLSACTAQQYWRAPGCA